MFGIDQNTLIFTGLVGVAAFALIYVFLFNQISNERNQEKRIKHIKNNEGDRQTRLQAESRLADAQKRRQSVQSSLKELEEKNRSRDPNKQGIKDQLRQAGMDITMNQFWIFSIICGVATAILAFFVVGNLIVAGAMLFVGTLGLPRWFVGMKRKRRFNAFLEEFPNAVDVITRGIKAGLPINDCIGIIAAEAKEPVGSEFRKIVEAQKMGLPMTEAIQKLYRNVPLTEANFFGIVIAIQQSAGGNLSEALGNLSNVLRDRKKMKAKIVAMSQEAKSSAGIIGSLPVIVSGLIYLTTPDYISILFTTTPGNIILGCSAIWMSMGILVMKQMINFDF